MEEQEDYGKEIEGTWVKESAIDLTKLREVFPSDDIEWRVQSSGKKKNGELWAKVLAYITNRAIMDRLDKVCGPENWKNDFISAPNGGTLCGLSIKVNGEWITKWDGAENTDIESVKGGLSNAMKRAGVQWGIGRYLYNLTTGWADINPSGTHNDKLKDGTWFKWNPPKLPGWALPTLKSPKKPQNAPQSTKPQNKGNTVEETNKQLILALKKKIGEKMVGMNNDEKKAMYDWVLNGRKATIDLLQHFLDKYDDFSVNYEFSKKEKS